MAVEQDQIVREMADHITPCSSRGIIEKMSSGNTLNQDQFLAKCMADLQTLASKKESYIDVTRRYKNADPAKI